MTDQHRELVDALNEIRVALGAHKSYHIDMPKETAELVKAKFADLTSDLENIKDILQREREVNE